MNTNKRIKITIVFLFTFLISSCGKNLEFIDKESGVTYIGKTGTKIMMGNHGKLKANIENEHYEGKWIHSLCRNKNCYSLYYSTTDIKNVRLPSNIIASGSGSIGLFNRKSGFIRCVFDFKDHSTGAGICRRKNDGKLFDFAFKQ